MIRESHFANILVVSNYGKLHSVRPEAEILIGLKKMGYKITVLTDQTGAYVPILKSYGINIIHCPIRKKKDAFSISKIQALLNSGKFDVLQLFNNKAITNGLAAVKVFPDIKVVIYRGASANMAWWNPINYLKFFNPRIDGVICNAESSAQKFKLSLTKNAYKVTVIPKGHNIEWYHQVEPIDIYSKYNWPIHTKIFITVANNRRVKGMSYLTHAIARLPKNTTARFVWIGRGLSEHQSQLQKNKHLVKVLDHQEDPLPWIKGSSAFILPSIGSENLTKFVIESMCLGKTGILTNLFGNQLLTGPHLITVPAKESKALLTAILEMTSMEDLDSKGIKSQKHIHLNLNHKDTVDAYHKFYQEILATS